MPNVRTLLHWRQRRAFNKWPVVGKARHANEKRSTMSQPLFSKINRTIRAAADKIRSSITVAVDNAAAAILNKIENEFHTKNSSNKTSKQTTKTKADSQMEGHQGNDKTLTINNPELCLGRTNSFLTECPPTFECEDIVVLNIQGSHRLGCKKQLTTKKAVRQQGTTQPNCNGSNERLINNITGNCQFCSRPFDYKDRPELNICVCSRSVERQDRENNCLLCKKEISLQFLAGSKIRLLNQCWCTIPFKALQQVIKCGPSNIVTAPSEPYFDEREGKGKNIHLKLIEALAIKIEKSRPKNFKRTGKTSVKIKRQPTSRKG